MIYILEVTHINLEDREYKCIDHCIDINSIPEHILYRLTGNHNLRLENFKDFTEVGSNYSYMTTFIFIDSNTKESPRFIVEARSEIKKYQREYNLNRIL